MDFTREPIVETVITPREGYRLVVRSSKSAGLEEHFVDALEVVTFGNASFFRSTERPKPFVVPVGDYEILEVREPRMVLKTPIEGSIKIAAAEKGRRQQPPVEKELPIEKEEQPAKAGAQATMEAKTDRRRDRRRGFRRRRGAGREEGQEGALGEEQAMPEGAEAPFQAQAESPLLENAPEMALPNGDEAVDVTRGDVTRDVTRDVTSKIATPPVLSQILPPPTTLIRDDLERLRKHDAYKSAFYREGEFEESDTPTEPFGFTETDIDMKEGGDQEVPPKDSFRETPSESFFSEDLSEDKKVDQP